MAILMERMPDCKAKQTILPWTLACHNLYILLLDKYMTKGHPFREPLCARVSVLAN